jgi:hypothetical protein
MGSEGSNICPISPFARIRDVTPSSQAKKSSFDVRMDICDTVGRALDTIVGVKAGECEGLGKCCVS